MSYHHSSSYLIFLAQLSAIGGETTIRGEIITHCKLVEAYDPHTRSWTTVTNIKAVRSGTRAVAFDGKIYVIGGQDHTFCKYDTFHPVAHACRTFCCTCIIAPWLNPIF